MALTIAQRPKGLVFGTAVTAAIDDNGGGGQFRISSISHGLVTGDTVYVDSDISAYNGYWIVQLDGVNTFFITPYVGGDRVSYISGSSVDYYAGGVSHGWSCVHLPIVYRITNTRWPTNSEDTAQTISTLNDDLGYARVTLSGSLGTFEDLSFVKISSAANSDFDGVYQILDKISTSNITLNVAYNTFNGAGLLGATIQLYYGNYNTVVRVYAGINSSHTWTSQKPYELAATLELIPDDDNVVAFSINEILKAYVETKNNLLLGTLPNNIDAWVNFYIEYAEQYDSSNGYTVSTTLSSFTSDLSTFEGTAVNAVLPFKNVQSGFLSEYLGRNGGSAKFLTLFREVIPTPDNPAVEYSSGVIFDGQYFDISVLLNSSTDVIVFKRFYLNGVDVSGGINTALENYGFGVYRIPIETSQAFEYDTIFIKLYNNASSQDHTEGYLLTLNTECSNQEIYLSWLNYLGGFDYWLFNTETGKAIDVLSTSETTKNIFPEWPRSYDQFSDTIRKQVSRESTNRLFLTTQYLTEDQADAVAYIKTSPLVQIVNSKSDRRTIIVDSDSFTKYTDNQKLITISFSARYTDNIGSQKV